MSGQHTLFLVLALTLLPALIGPAIAPVPTQAAETPAPTGEAPVQAGTPLGFTEADVLRAPQDLTPFAEQAGADRLLLSPAEQASRDAKANSLFFGPLTQTRPSLTAQRFRESVPGKPRGFHLDKPWTQAEWAALLHEVQARAYPTPKGPALVIRHTDIRTMPTAEPLYLEATTEPAMDFFDFFQLASLPLGTPVYISHTSRSGEWVYVEYPLLTGWVKTSDVALMPRALARTYMNGKYAAIVRDHVPLTTADGTPLGLTHMGSVFPYQMRPDPSQAGQTPSSADAETTPLLVPVRTADGTARLEPVRPPKDSALPKPLPLTPAALATLGNRMLGQPYAWGGSGHNRDCSLATRDLFLPFGIWLPRNSRVQAQSSAKVNLERQSPAARKAYVLRHATPFMTLLGFSGHVGLYVGTHNGEPVMLHNILGLRTNNPDTFYRHLVGKCVLSTLEPGKDVPELLLDETLLERLRSLRTLH